MTLKNTIKRILNEESKPPILFRRRLIVIDKIFKDKLKYFYGPQTCLYKNPQEFIDMMVYSVAESLYHTYLSDLDDESKEWKETYKYIENHIKKEYTEKLTNYYYDNCKY